MKKLKSLWPYPQKLNSNGKFSSPKELIVKGNYIPENIIGDIREVSDLLVENNDSSYVVMLNLNSDNIKREGYNLSLNSSGCTITASDKSGLSYGIQTFLQIIALYNDEDFWPQLEISDWPAYRKRSFMVDMGRSVYTLPMLKRIIRILHRLKMNQLHMHLYDDELCGIRFEGLPFGKENPYAISLDDFSEIVQYAQKYHVEIVPELEGWGHVGSIVYHREDLRGGEGVYNGASFLVCEEMFSLMENMISQIAKVLPDNSVIHLGLDEAKWFLSSEMNKSFSPSDLVERYYNIIQEIGKEQNKKFTLRIWADHSGRPVPEHIQHNVIIEPWQYWIVNSDSVDSAVKKYSANKKMRWMAGAGVSSAQYRGAYHVTRYWAKQSLKSENGEGVNITFWTWNNIEQKFISLFAGAYFIWNPVSPVEFTHSEDYEVFDQYVFPIMYWWQGTFKDAFPDNMQKDSGPIVFNGYYMWGDRHDQPVAPTVLTANTKRGHDFLNE